MGRNSPVKGKMSVISELSKHLLKKMFLPFTGIFGRRRK